MIIFFCFAIYNFSCQFGEGQQSRSKKQKGIFMKEMIAMFLAAITVQLAPLAAGCSPSAPPQKTNPKEKSAVADNGDMHEQGQEKGANRSCNRSSNGE